MQCQKIQTSFRLCQNEIPIWSSITVIFFSVKKYTINTVCNFILTKYEMCTENKKTNIYVIQLLSQATTY